MVSSFVRLLQQERYLLGGEFYVKIIKIKILLALGGQLYVDSGLLAITIYI